MTRIDIDAVTDIIREVAIDQVLPRFRHLAEGDIAFKLGDDPVTIADKESEKALTTKLSALLKGSITMGEEAFSLNNAILEGISGDKPTWIIDPIDGTRNFVKGSREFGIIVALSERNETIAGWLYDPTTDEVITAERGSGTWYKGHKLKVLEASSLTQMTGFFGDRLMAAFLKSSIPRDMRPFFEDMSAGVHEYPRLLLNRPHFGKDKPQVHFRASLHHSTPWDDAAGVLMHLEAGGYSGFWDGSPYQPAVMNKGLVLAPSKESWDEFRTWCKTFAPID